METCKWIHYKGESLWITECGQSQGIKVRPKQKKCYCGKRIERIETDEISPREKKFRNMLATGYYE